MDGLPFLPGNTFNDPTKTKYHVSQTLGYRNGYALQKRPELGIGGTHLWHNQLNEQELDELANFKPTLTYGQAKQAAPEDFVPAHVAWDKKVLKFCGWYKQTVHESPNEYYRVRPVKIYYYLEDDSISVVEPQVENSGIPQGKLIRRQRLPKDDVGDHWHWKDINIGINVVFYGKVFHIYDCDKFTRNYMESEGIEVANPELCPKDPYIEKRVKAAELQTFKTPTDFDKQRQFLEMDRKVLRFYCVWDDRDQMFGENRKFILHYYLVDDTLEVREVHNNNDGHDPFPLLINRHKVPKNRYNVESTFPAIVMELTENELKEYYTPVDFSIGKTVKIYNRRFLIYDMDNFTKAFYWKNFKITDFQAIDVDDKGRKIAKMEIPPYNGYGTLEDSLQSCLTLIPQPPKKDFIKLLENDGVTLRYEACLDSEKPEDAGRRFVISYRLSDDMVSVYEPPVRNSGIIGGKFLENTRVAKPESTIEHPVYYGPQDFYIGAVIPIFAHKFIIRTADRFVLTFMEKNADQFPEHTIQSLRNQLGEAPTARGIIKNSVKDRDFRPGELDGLVREVKGQLKKIAITSSNRKDQVFLNIDTDRQGFISKANLQEMCHKQHLPCDPEIIDRLAAEINPCDPEHISLECLREFLETSQ